MRPVVAYTLHSWEHRQAQLRLVAPWRAAGVEVRCGAQWDQVDLEPISSAGLVHIHRDFPRLAKAYHQVIQRSREANLPVVYDLDEDLFHMPPDHPDRQFHYRSDALFPVFQAIVEADTVTVSTPALLELVQPLNPNTRLLPSYLDDQRWSFKMPLAREKDSPFVIGWINDQPAQPDGFVDGMERFLRGAGQHALLRVWGAKPPLPLLDLANVDWLPALPLEYSKYVEQLSQQKCSLIVVPHHDHPYYRSMSPAPFFEISACGIPGIFSRVPPYQSVIDHPKNGWLAETSDEWADALDSVYQFDSSRLRAAEEAQRTIQRDWLLSTHAGDWARLYRELDSRDIRSNGQKALANQAAELTAQVREWQRDVEERVQQRDWEVRALNVTIKQKEREASQRIEQLDAQLHAIWESPTWKLMDNIRHPTRLFSRPATGSSLPETAVTPEQESKPNDRASDLDSLPQANTYDVIFIEGGERDEDLQRNRQLIGTLARQGVRIFRIITRAPAMAGDQPTEARIFTIEIPQSAKKSIEDSPNGISDPAVLRPFFEQLQLEAGIYDAVCWVADAAWYDLAFCLRNWFDWKVVIAGEPASHPIRERSDLCLTSGLESRWVPLLQLTIPDLFPRASLIVLTYNNLSYTRQCLESIYAKTSYPNFEVVLVDNASTDGTPDFLRSFTKGRPEDKWILNPENRGFSGGNNQGVEASTGEYLVLLNNDVVLTYGWLSRLIGHLRNAQIGAVGPVTNYSGNESRISVDYSELTGLDDFARRYTHAHLGQTFDIRMLALYCIAFRRSLIEEVGLLDERFNIGMYEDDDFSLRIRQKGYRLLCAEDVYIHHWGSAAFSQMAAERFQRLHEENRAKFEEKWGTRWQPHRGRMAESEPG